MLPDNDRHRDWPGFVNARTLAGLPTQAGPIRRGRMYRSDEPVGDTDVVVKVLHAEGIATVLDLRSVEECERRPSLLSRTPMYKVAPLVDPRMDHLRDPASERNLLDLYRGSVDRNGYTIVDALRCIVEAPEAGGVLIHCAAGKDRTGILTAVILALLGTPRESIVEDYTLTQDRLAPYFAAELAAIEDPEKRERVADRQRSTAETMEGLLAHLDDHYGGAAVYLKQHGLSEPEMIALSDRLTR